MRICLYYTLFTQILHKKALPHVTFGAILVRLTHSFIEVLSEFVLDRTFTHFDYVYFTIGEYYRNSSHSFSSLAIIEQQP